jgi:hypothetical protein
MSRRNNLPPMLVLALSALMLAGCDLIAELIPSLNTVQVVLVNDTSYPVDPNIRFDDDETWLAELFPSETLNSGSLDAGESASFDFDCDQLGVIFSDNAEQSSLLFLVYVADETRILERGDDYDCGDVIEFRFVGNGGDFGVVVSVNGRVVD